MPSVQFQDQTFGNLSLNVLFDEFEELHITDQGCSISPLCYANYMIIALKENIEINFTQKCIAKILPSFRILPDVNISDNLVTD